MFKLTQQQQEIIDSPARIKLVMGGRASGKTTLAILNLWENMKKTRVSTLYLVSRDDMLIATVKEIEYLLPVSKKYWHKEYKHCMVLITAFGKIYVSTEMPNNPWTNDITIDNATSNKYVDESLFEIYRKIYITGHFPEDMNNVFFMLWLRQYFMNDYDCQAFRLGTWDCPFMESKRAKQEDLMLQRMDKSRYNRDFLCIPDYTKDTRQDKFRREYFAEFPKFIDPKDYAILGFDKAKE
jgi:hypothetical protein